MSESRLERDLAGQLDLLARSGTWPYPAPVRELRFAPPRRWRFDFAWPEQKVAVECDGGTRTGGRHVRPLGYEADQEKGNAAVLAGWRVLHFTQRDITSGEALRIIEAALKAGES